MRQMKPWTAALSVALAAGLVLCGCESRLEEEEGTGSASAAGAASSGGGSMVDQIAQQRKLSPDDVAAALKTYVPSGRMDEYILFASGGHSGQVFVIGVPSMRLLKTIAVFTPEPWQGWGYGTGEDILEAGNVNGHKIHWADTHHPALSESNADYDGQFLFINDKANARVGVIDLRDFETKQIVKNPLAINDHGGTFVTPNTEYVIEGGQYGTPLGWSYAPMEEYREKYRGLVTFWKFDRSKGRVDASQSFCIELPPYWQDLFDAGRFESDGWCFGNSINTELATGGVEEGKPPFEAGASQRDNDYLHIINWRKAVALAKAGKVEQVKGFPMITLKTAIDEGILYFAPEPKSPHGVDVTPKGEFLVVSGKLDPHVSVYSFAKIQSAISNKRWTPDPYGVPILDYDAVKEAQVEVGLGPLHTQFDDQGYAYTSLFLDSAVARWTLGGPYQSLHDEPGWSLVTKKPVQYNVGHVVAAEGDTASPDGRYLISLNKWSIDRFFHPGPLFPQNLQLIDISQPGDRMQLVYDMPIGMGEPHYAQLVKADKLKPWNVYPEIGWDPQKQAVDSDAPKPGNEKVVRDGNTVTVYMTATRSHFNPEHVKVQQGDHVIWKITNTERTEDATHGFALPGYDINLSLEPGETATLAFDATDAGVYTWYCSEFCSALHLEMMGYFLVAPKSTADAVTNGQPIAAAGAR
jgi:nitrous-oxide reductase